MSIEPWLDDSRWTIAPCSCKECRLDRDRRFRETLAELAADAGLTITCRLWTQPTPNLPARRRWLARRSRMIIGRKTILFCGWDLTAPSGRQRWYPTRESMIHGARAFRTSELHQQALDAIAEIGMELIS